MSKPTKDAFATIDPAALQAVAGGRRAASGRSSSADFEDKMMDTLNNIENAIRDLGRNQPKGNDALSQLMPLLAMSMLNQPSQPNVIYRKKC